MRDVIDGLIAGRLYGAPTARTTKAGKAFCTGKLRVTTGNGESVFVSVIAFSTHAVAGLLALSDGDAVALAGALTASAFVDKAGAARPSLDLVAHAVLTPYSVGRKRAAMRPSDAPSARDEQPPVDEPLSAGETPAEAVSAPNAAKDDFVDDDIPF